MTEPTLSDALDLLPEAWHDNVADDAAGQGCTLGYTAAACAPQRSSGCGVTSPPARPTPTGRR